MARKAKYKDVLCKMPLATKVLNRTKRLILGGHLDFLEARLCPVEQLDKRPPWKAESRTMQEQLSRTRAWVHIIMDVPVTNINDVHHSNGIPQGDRLSFAPRISHFMLKLYMRKSTASPLKHVLRILG